MKLLIITHVEHIFDGEKYWAYGPYIKEMNIWEKHISALTVVAPKKFGTPTSIDLHYNSESICFIAVPSFVLIGFRNRLKAMLDLPRILLTIYSAMRKTDHIHLRCPGNMGLLGSIVQVLFPNKVKTAKYAGNWDFKSKQPWSYRLQQIILRNTFLTRNMKVLVYGDWNETENIKPFFTATYSQKEKVKTLPRSFDSAQPIKLIFVGGLNGGKRPKLSLEVALQLHKQGIRNEIHFYGEGIERKELEQFIGKNHMQEYAFLHGNVIAEIVKQAFQRSHFLVFISKSEGWPKAVAEAMFWGCLPLTTAVSCLPEMLGNGERGNLVESDSYLIVKIIKDYILNSEVYSMKCISAMKWSRQFTLEKFEDEIKGILL